MKNIYYILLTGLLFAGCTQMPSPKLKSLSYGDYQESSFDAIPSWKNENFEEALAVFMKTCTKTSSKELYKRSCENSKRFINKDGHSAKEFFQTNFTPFVSLSTSSLATGYFEPKIEGSLEKKDEFVYPLYGVPSDLLKIELSKRYKKQLKHPLRGRLVDGSVKPYFTREEINDNALASQEPICYVKDKIDLFFLQVQGSGSVQLDDNSILYVGYADQNGYPYVSIGKEMIKQGLIKREDVSLQSIRRYLQEHPEQSDMILNANPSYVFFEKRSHSASGALGLVLEAERSVAVDRKNIPLGMPMFVSTDDPLGGKKFEKIVFAHDTGGAIKGEARIDIFYGSGKHARQKAGHMKNRLDMWLLIPNDYLTSSN